MPSNPVRPARGKFPEPTYEETREAMIKFNQQKNRPMTLLERLEAATEGSRELDIETLKHFGFRKGDLPSAQERLTTSIDAALALVERVLPEWKYRLINVGFDNGVYQNGKVQCDFVAPWSSGPVTYRVFAETLPLAIMIALVKAKAEQ